MNIDAVTPLRLRMVEDRNARKLCAQTQRGHIHSCKRFAEFLKRSPDTATAEDIRRFSVASFRDGHEHLQSQPYHDRGTSSTTS
jgi:integrase/recombinase XerD